MAVVLSTKLLIIINYNTVAIICILKIYFTILNDLQLLRYFGKCSDWTSSDEPGAAYISKRSLKTKSENNLKFIVILTIQLWSTLVVEYRNLTYG